MATKSVLKDGENSNSVEQNEEDTYACQLCFKLAGDVGELGHCLDLMFWEDKYHIIDQQGHNIVYTFEEKPIPEPQDSSVVYLNWYGKVYKENLRFKVGLSTAESIVDICRDAGHTEEDGCIFTFFYDHVAKIIARKVK